MRGGELGVDMSDHGDCRASSLICTRLTNLVAEYQVQRLAIEAAFRGKPPTGVSRGSSPLSQRPGYKPAATGDLGDCFESALTALRSRHWARVLEISELYEMLPKKTQERWNQRLMAWRLPGYRRGDFPWQDLPELDTEAARQLVCDLPRQGAARIRSQLLGILSGLCGNRSFGIPGDFPEHIEITWQGRVEGRGDYERIAQITSLRCIAARLLELDTPSFESTAKAVTQVSLGRAERTELDRGNIVVTRRDKKTVLITISRRLVGRFNILLRTGSA